VASVHDLGVYINADLCMGTRLQRTVTWCFAVLRHLQLRQIRRHILPVTFQTLQTLLVALVNGVPVGLPAYLVRRLSHVVCNNPAPVHSSCVGTVQFTA